MLHRAHVVQEVDVLLAQLLRSLTQSGLLHAHIAKLRAQRAKALGDVLADAKLLRGQIADTLAQCLLQLRLLAQDVGLLASDVGVLASKPGLLPSQLAVQSGSALRQLTLLASRAKLTLARGLGQACALQTQLTHLLARAQRADTRLAQHIGSLHAQLGTLDAVLTLHLLVGQGRLKRLLRIQALSLERRGLVLDIGLLLIGQVGQGRLQTSLGAQLLRGLLRSQVLLAHSEASLLIGQGRLHGLLGVHALGLQLSSLVLHRGLLSRRQILRANSEASLLVGLLGREPRLLLHVELVLCLLVSLLQASGLDIPKLRTQVALTLSLNNGLAAAAKRSSSSGRGLLLCALDVGLANSFALLGSHHVLHVRRHVGLGGAGLGKTLRAHALGRTHLSGLHLRRVNLLGGHALGRTHLESLQVWSVPGLGTLHLCASNVLSANSGGRTQALRGLLSLLRGAVQGADALLRHGPSLAHGLLTLTRTLHHGANALLEPGLHGRLTGHLLGHIKILARATEVAHACASDVGQVANCGSWLGGQVVGLLSSEHLPAGICAAHDVRGFSQSPGPGGDVACTGLEVRSECADACLSKSNRVQLLRGHPGNLIGRQRGHRLRIRSLHEGQFQVLNRLRFADYLFGDFCHVLTP